ncbi:hypothetical protein BJF78_07535 [Pseudonocardia sp. CNS-139]|nr:hypothetical protein BJF78_07535 [Pseudonocardia sp. CNS-139]
MTDLAGTVERLRALRPEYPDAYGVEVGEPAEPGWTPLAAVTPAVVAEWCAQALEIENPGRLASVAASAVAGELTHVVLGRVAAAVLLERRGWDVHAANIALRRTEDGAVNAAVRDGGLLVLPDDPAAGGPGVTVVPDLGALLDRVAAAAVGTLAPLFVAIRAATRYGMVPLWNGTADSVLAAAAYVPLYAGMDGAERPAARRLGHVFVDTLIRHAPGSAAAAAASASTGTARRTRCRCAPRAASTTRPSPRWTSRPTRTA